ncbi:MAG: hypothetical protein RIF33_00795 [Cyclobacteriaceae bacterium]
MKIFLLNIALLLSTSLYSQDLHAIRQQLEEIEQQNLELRDRVMPTVNEFGFDSPQMDSLNQQIQLFDSIALIAVTAILDKHGWLGQNQIGEIANRAIFLVIQHAPNNSIRKMYFSLLEASARNGESELSAMATMKDRILVQDGELQIYGTQSRMVNGELELFPIENIDNINALRKQVGLGEMK